MSVRLEADPTQILLHSEDRAEGGGSVWEVRRKMTDYGLFGSSKLSMCSRHAEECELLSMQKSPKRPKLDSIVSSGLPALL